MDAIKYILAIAKQVYKFFSNIGSPHVYIQKELTELLPGS